VKVNIEAKVPENLVDHPYFGGDQISKAVEKALLDLADSERITLRSGVAVSVALTKKGKTKVIASAEIVSAPVVLHEEEVTYEVERVLRNLVADYGLDTETVAIKVTAGDWYGPNETPFGAGPGGIEGDLKAAYEQPWERHDDGPEAFAEEEAVRESVDDVFEGDKGVAQESQIGASEFGVRLEALDKAIRVSVESGAEAVVKSANIFLDFLFGKDKSDADEG